MIDVKQSLVQGKTAALVSKINSSLHTLFLLFSLSMSSSPSLHLCSSLSQTMISLFLSPFGYFALSLSLFLSPLSFILNFLLLFPLSVSLSVALTIHRCFSLTHSLSLFLSLSLFIYLSIPRLCHTLSLSFLSISLSFLSISLPVSLTLFSLSSSLKLFYGDRRKSAADSLKSRCASTAIYSSWSFGCRLIISFAIKINCVL